MLSGRPGVGWEEWMSAEIYGLSSRLASNCINYIYLNSLFVEASRRHCHDYSRICLSCVPGVIGSCPLVEVVPSFNNTATSSPELFPSQQLRLIPIKFYRILRTSIFPHLHFSPINAITPSSFYDSSIVVSMSVVQRHDQT